MAYRSAVVRLCLALWRDRRKASLTRLKMNFFCSGDVGWRAGTSKPDRLIVLQDAAWTMEIAGFAGLEASSSHMMDSPAISRRPFVKVCIL